jgi:hypothetical protein
MPPSAVSSRLSVREEVMSQIEATKVMTERILPRELYGSLRVPVQQIKSLDGPSTHPAVYSTELV